MKRGRIVLLVAMAIYVASFFVSAVGRVYGGRVSPSIVGYECAVRGAAFPMDGRRIEVVSREPFAFYRLGFQRLDQPGFSGSDGFSAEEKDPSATTMLRTALLLMMPACWIVFYQEHATPGSGTFSGLEAWW